MGFKLCDRFQDEDVEYGGRKSKDKKKESEQTASS